MSQNYPLSQWFHVYKRTNQKIIKTASLWLLLLMLLLLLLLLLLLFATHTTAWSVGWNIIPLRCILFYYFVFYLTIVFISLYSYRTTTFIKNNHTTLQILIKPDRWYFNIWQLSTLRFFFCYFKLCLVIVCPDSCIQFFTLAPASV